MAVKRLCVKATSNNLDLRGIDRVISAENVPMKSTGMTVSATDSDFDLRDTQIDGFKLQTSYQSEARGRMAQAGSPGPNTTNGVRSSGRISGHESDRSKQSRRNHLLIEFQVHVDVRVFQPAFAFRCSSNSLHLRQARLLACSPHQSLINQFSKTGHTNRRPDRTAQYFVRFANLEEIFQ